MFPRKEKKVGMFGGSFNPPHQAHSELASYALSKLKLDLLVFLPNYKSVEKLELGYLSGEESVSLISLSAPSGWVMISDYELSSKEAVESVVSLSYFKESFSGDKLFFLLGADHCSTLNNWQGIDEILSISTLAIFSSANAVQALDSLSFLSEELLSAVIFLKNSLFPHSSTLFSESRNYALLHKKVSKYLCSKAQK